MSKLEIKAQFHISSIKEVTKYLDIAARRMKIFQPSTAFYMVLILGNVAFHSPTYAMDEEIKEIKTQTSTLRQRIIDAFPTGGCFGCCKNRAGDPILADLKKLETISAKSSKKCLKDLLECKQSSSKHNDTIIALNVCKDNSNTYEIQLKLRDDQLKTCIQNKSNIIINLKECEIEKNTLLSQSDTFNTPCSTKVQEFYSLNIQESVIASSGLKGFASGLSHEIIKTVLLRYTTWRPQNVNFAANVLRGPILAGIMYYNTDALWPSIATSLGGAVLGHGVDRFVNEFEQDADRTSNLGVLTSFAPGLLFAQVSPSEYMTAFLSSYCGSAAASTLYNRYHNLIIDSYDKAKYGFSYLLNNPINILNSNFSVVSPVNNQPSRETEKSPRMPSNELIQAKEELNKPKEPTVGVKEDALNSPVFIMRKK
ncbi:MAG: hypothetical protein H0X26_05725 [Alphaproteobacteria bacterium]|nr:hypothetical protein [Alphaproteobacteria bacterium]